MKTEPSKRFFITHAHADNPFAQRFADDLSRFGLDGFFDIYSIKPGDNIPANINKGLAECDIYVPILSNAALNSPWCEEEITTAMTLSKMRDRNGRPHIIPVLIEDCQSRISQQYPTLLTRLYISFVDRYEEALKDLVVKGFGLSADILQPNHHQEQSQSELYTELMKACSLQVEAEITTMVGKKFIPELYVNRDAQEKLNLLLRPEQHLFDPALELKLQDERDDPAQEMPREFWQDYTKPVLKGSNSKIPSKNVISELSPKANGRMYILTARAGTGKTNLLCHLAEQYVKEQPTIFLTSRSGITERTSIKELIESKVGKFLSHSSYSDLFDKLIYAAEKDGKRLIVFIDALNEHRDIELLNASISEFLLAIKGRPVIVLASCRDIYWDFFEYTVWPQDQFSKLDLNFKEFSLSEATEAVVSYFDRYRISANLSERAQNKLAHPLILRFFCETYGNPQSDSLIYLPSIRDLRLKALFDEYIRHKLDSIRFTSPKRRRNSKELEDFLFSLAMEMRKNKSSEVSLDALSRVTSQTDLDSPDSAYVAILGEDILLEEKPADNSHKIQVRFTFEEFMEYMIARSMILEKLPLTYQKAKSLVSETFQISSFSNFVGIFEYVCTMLREDYDIPVWDDINIFPEEMKEAIIRAVGKMKSELVGESELRMLENLLVLDTDVPDVTIMQQFPKYMHIRNLVVDNLLQLINENDCTAYARMRVFEIIRKVLTFAESPELRYSVCRHFEHNNLIPTSKESNRIAEWWRNHKKGIEKKTILISNYEKEIVDLLVSYLRFKGFSQVYCETGTLETIETAKRIKPSLIVTNLRKPRMNGIEMAKVIKEDPTLRDTRFFLLSAQAEQSNIQKYIEANLFSHFMKIPVDLDQFVEQVYILLIGRMEEEIEK